MTKGQKGQKQQPDSYGMTKRRKRQMDSYGMTKGAKATKATHDSDGMTKRQDQVWTVLDQSWCVQIPTLV